MESERIEQDVFFGLNDGDFIISIQINKTHLIYSVCVGYYGQRWFETECDTACDGRHATALNEEIIELQLKLVI